MNFNFLKSLNVALDLGNNNTVVSDQNRILLSQPSYIVLDPESHAVKAVGEKAFNMFEKNHESLMPIKPLKGGVIADYESATMMIREMLMKAYPSKSFLSGYNNIISGVPFYSTAVEQQALRDAIGQFDCRNAFMVYEPLAAALGIGLDIRSPDGKMLIDIGGGITEIVVISLSGIACCQSLKVAGDTFDMEIQDYFRKRHNMAIGLKTAEQVKFAVGAVLEELDNPPPPMMVRGKDLMKGIPAVQKITHREVARILEKSITMIEIGILQTLESCPPELAADIFGAGIHITGGNAMLRGLRERLEDQLRLPIHIDSQALYSVTRGVAQTLADPKKYEALLIS
jgi:rod shape-determining protein MreB